MEAKAFTGIYYHKSYQSQAETFRCEIHGQIRVTAKTHRKIKNGQKLS